MEVVLEFEKYVMVSVEVKTVSDVKMGGDGAETSLDVLNKANKRWMPGNACRNPSSWSERQLYLFEKSRNSDRCLPVMIPSNAWCLNLFRPSHFRGAILQSN